MRAARNSRRERQSVWCCELNYQRWRLRSGDWTDTHHTHCCRCQQPLAWPEKRVLALPNPRRASRLYKRRQAEKFTALGLTTNGRQRQRQPNFICRSDRVEANRQSSLRSYHGRASMFAMEGLTSRGTQRKYAPALKPSDKELAYRALREDMSIERGDGKDEL